MTVQPDPRLLEDLVTAGELRLKRARPDEHDAITAAVRWLLERARELREAGVRG